MIDSTKWTHTLNKIETNEAIETLGVHLAPNGNEIPQFEALKSKALKWANRMKQRGILSKQDAWIGFTSTILKTLQYPLPVTCLTEAQCTTILAPILNVSLPAIGISRKFCRKYIQAPYECMGIGIPSLYTFQGASHIDLLVSHWKSDSDTGRLVRATVESLQLELGCSINPLHLPYDKWHQAATNSWIKHTWEFM